jgi:pyruvate dehydrogenase E1 component alpha subunit/2-oxoisovalerate dehydrogenase E1 component alpha subunit
VVVGGYLGDGATSEADFHAGLNFAGVWKAPVVFVCQNNQWAISVPVEAQTAVKEIVRKADGYGVPGVRVDGNDVLAVYKVLTDAAERARKGEGPTFVEALTYRIGAHSTSDDPTRYRSDAEVEAWKKKDPVDRLAKHLRRIGRVDDAYEKKLDEELTAEIADVVKEVEALPAPERLSLFDDVYAELSWNLREQRDLLATMPPAPTH